MYLECSTGIWSYNNGLTRARCEGGTISVVNQEDLSTGLPDLTYGEANIILAASITLWASAVAIRMLLRQIFPTY